MKHFKILVFFGLALSFVEHWHGAAPDSWFTHVSIEPNIPNNQVTWQDPVTDEQYK